MIEFCNKKRMVISIACLVGVSVLVLVFENHLANHDRHIKTSAPVILPEKDLCWQRELFDIVEDCHPCTDFEKTSKSIPACVNTGYKEGVNCTKSGVVFRSCHKVTWLEERKFWTFEGSALLVGLVSSLLVFLRQKTLERRAYRRIQRQINAPF